MVTGLRQDTVLIYELKIIWKVCLPSACQVGMVYAKTATLVNSNCFKFESVVKIPLEALSCVWQCVVCVATDISLWVSGLEEGQVSQRRSTIPSLFDEETSCKIDEDLKVTGSSFRACSDQLPSAVRCSALPGLWDNTVSLPLANMVAGFDMIALQSGPLLWPLHLSGLTIEAGI